MVTPELNSFGTFTVVSPFTLPSGDFRCTGIVGISSLVNSGIDVFSLYYSSHGISSLSYSNDILAEVPIITLMSVDGTTVSLPSSYISTSPETKAIPYSNFHIVVDLGQLPNDIPLSQLRTDITSLVDDALGISSNLSIAVTPDVELRTFQNSSTLEIARKLQIVNRISDKSARRIAEQNIILYQQRIADLEAIIVSLS